jgi:SAM-dependent methyltransferase
VGVDLSPDFVAAARDFTVRVGLAERVTYAVTDGVTLPFDDDAFDAASMIHVGMNVPDKQALFSEVHRVLRPGGRFGIYEQMRTGDGELPYPLPWALDGTTSFVETAEAYEAALRGAGFTVTSAQDRTEAVAGPPPSDPSAARPLPTAVFGPEFMVRIQNYIAATRAGLLGAVEVLATVA